MAHVLNWLIPAILLAYAGWLIVHLIRQRGAACSGCPMAGSCSKKRKEEPEK